MAEQGGLCWPVLAGEVPSYGGDGLGLAGTELLQQQEAPATLKTPSGQPNTGLCLPACPRARAMARAADRKPKGNTQTFLLSAAHCKQQEAAFKLVASKHTFK